MSNDNGEEIVPAPSHIRRLFSINSYDSNQDTMEKTSSSSSIAIGTSSDVCASCGRKVYQVEKVGPVNKVVFHKGCFKCCQCGQVLTLRTYYTNPLDQSDRQLYCGKHSPKVASQGVDASAVGIRAALSAPTSGLQASMNEVVRWYGDVPKIDLDARHIREALLAQSEFDKKNMFDNRHHFPVWIGRSKKKLLVYQEELEKRQREEEDKLVKAFHDERVKEAEMMDKKIKEEWEVNLKELKKEFKSDGESGYNSRVDELNKTMTMKKASRMKELTLKLQSKAQEKTADMVKKHSEEMLTLLQAKHEELKKEIELEIESNGEDPKVLVEALTAMTIFSEVPEAHPPKIRKRDLYHDPSVFNELDEEVFKVAESEHCSFTELVDQLTANSISDLQKARAIFRWITVKDLNVMEFSETVQQETPLGLLRGIKYGTETYHSLFMRLCSYAGLVCREIKGHSKSVGYEPGMKILPDAFLNTWNVILIGGDWWPVQCNWGARHLIMNREQDPTGSKRHSTKRSRDGIRYEYDEHYFLTDPDEFIMEFRAHDGKWQLLEEPISLEKFESMPFVRSIFFQNSLEFEDASKRAILDTNIHGGVEVKLKIPYELKEDLVFHYHLRFADREKRREIQYNGVNLERYVFHTISDQLALFSVHVPIPGSYFVEIFVSRIGEGKKYQTEMQPTSMLHSFRLKCAAKLRVVCSAISGKMFPLPNCAPGEWGPMKAVRYFGITCLTHQVGVINTTEKVTIRFQLQKLMTVRTEMHFNGVDKRELTDFLGVKISQDLIATLEVVFPRKGQFGVDVYGNVDDQDETTGSLTHICKFLVNCTHVSRPVELPAFIQSPNSDLVRHPSLMHATENEYTLPAFLPSHTNQLKSQSSTESNDGAHNSLPTIPRDLPQPMESNSIPPPGPTPAFQLYGLKCLSHKSPDISDLDKQGGVTIEIGCPSGEFKLIPNLIRDSPKENWTHHVSVKQSSKKFKFQVTLPRYGKFWLVISAINKNEPQSRLSEVYTYVLQYSQNASVKRKISSMKK